MDEKYLWQYVMQVSPFTRYDEVDEIKELNDWDLLIKYKDGRRILFDRCTGYFKNVSYHDVNQITEEQEKKEFAYMLRTLMKRNWITQEQLANKVDTSQTMISHYLTGRSIPSATMLNKIAKAIGCSMDDFFNKNY